MARPCWKPTGGTWSRPSILRASLRDRLALDEARVEAIARGLEEVARLPDPVGEVAASWTRPNGLRFERVRTPLGVVGVIYESRPNVTADAGGLCLKSGNAAILRGGSESFHSSAAIVEALQEGLAEAGLPAACIQLAPTRDRALVGAMLTMRGAIDVVVPRGGKGLVQRVLEEARVPVIGHLEGLCHVYVDAAADLEKARRVAVNAKMRRTGVCGAAETILFDPRRRRDDHAGDPRRPDRRRLRGARRRRGLRRRGPRPARQRGRLGHGISGCGDLGAHGRWRRGRGPPYPPLRLAAHRHHPDRGRTGGGAFPRPCGQRHRAGTTPPPSSPMAASSASGRRSASRPTSSMRAGRSGRSS